MPTLIIKSGTTAIAGATVKGSFSYFSGSTKDLGPTSSTGFYAGIDAPAGGYTVYQIGGPSGWNARVATDTSSLNSILISAGGTGSTVDQNITWATNTNSVFINSGATVYTIGQAALGGVIAYINGGGSTGTSGLVSATSDQSAAIDWGCMGTSITTSSAIGSGAANTAAILAGCATRPIAASVAAAHTGGGYTDWYLPSLGELAQVYNNRTAIGNFFPGNWWSSTQNDASNANYIFFLNGNQTNQQKSSSFRVRAVRSF
jgi:hypothetical protein